MQASRRGFLIGLGSGLGTALIFPKPAIARLESLMPIKIVPTIIEEMNRVIVGIDPAKIGFDTTVFAQAFLTDGGPKVRLNSLMFVPEKVVKLNEPDIVQRLEFKAFKEWGVAGRSSLVGRHAPNKWFRPDGSLID